MADKIEYRVMARLTTQPEMYMIYLNGVELGTLLPTNPDVDVIKLFEEKGWTKRENKYGRHN